MCWLFHLSGLVTFLYGRECGDVRSMSCPWRNFCSLAAKQLKYNLLFFKCSIMVFKSIPLNLGHGYRGCFSSLHRRHLLRDVGVDVDSPVSSRV